MKNVICTFILMLSLAGFLASQQSILPEVVKRNRLKIAEAYVFEDSTSQASFLIKRDSFNKMGYVTLTEIHGREGLRTSYQYKYKDDTIRTERITMFKDKFHSKTKIWYDKKNREVKAIDYDEDGKKMGNYSKIKYNDKLRTKRTKIVFKDKNARIETLTKYDENEKVQEYWMWKNGKWLLTTPKEGDKPNGEQIKNYNGTTNEYNKTQQIIEEDVTIIGVKGSLKLKKGDHLMTEVVTSNEGLVIYTKQYLNDVFQGLKKNSYTFY